MPAKIPAPKAGQEPYKPDPENPTDSTHFSLKQTDLVKAAEDYLALLKGRKDLVDPSAIVRMVYEHQRLIIESSRGTAEETADVVGDRSSRAASSIVGGTEEVKRIRSDAVFYLRERGYLWREVSEIVGVKRARLDQILKGVSGGAYHDQTRGGNTKQGDSNPSDRVARTS